MYEQQIIIAGAGPTGLMLAIELARRGLEPRIVDAAAGPSVGTKGKGLQPRTQEIFDMIGVMPAFEAAGGLYQRLRFHFGPFSFRGSSLGTSHARSIERPYPNLWQVAQFKTEGILRAHLSSLGVEVEFGKRIDSFTQDANGVEVAMQGERVRCAYLIGCDGGRSIVRKTLGFELFGETVEDKPMLVGDVQLEALSRDDWHIWPLAKGGMLGLCPLPNADFFQVTCPAVDDVARHIERVTKLRVTRVLNASTYTPQARMVKHYRDRRVFLAGDAAHLHPPAGGQGLNTGIQDAWNLGWKLASVLRGGPESILDTYEEERLPVAAGVLNLSKTLHVKRSLKRGELTNQLGLNYRESSLSSGSPLGDLHPGDRMPISTALRHANATQFTRADGTRILVRPDGYIARISRDDTGEYAGAPVLNATA